MNSEYRSNELPDVDITGIRLSRLSTATANGVVTGGGGQAQLPFPLNFCASENSLLVGKFPSETTKSVTKNPPFWKMDLRGKFKI